MQRFLLCSLSLAFIVCFTSINRGQVPVNGPLAKKASWQRVNKAINDGLPKTAISELKTIAESAKTQGRSAEFVRAIATRIMLESNIEGNKATERIIRLEKEVETADKEIKPLMQALLANWYWHHFRQNRWRYQQRTQVAGEVGDDIDSWDLQSILKKIDGVFQESLSADTLLKTIPVARYIDLLDAGNVSDDYRPTLFDIVGHNAIEFYASGEQAASRSKDFFVADASGPILSDADAFAKWKPDTTDSNSPTLRAISLYQQLLSFHAEDANRLAYADIDLARLVFANAKAAGSEKQARYRTGLERLIQRYETLEVSALARAYLAETYQSDSEFLKAKSIAQAGAEAFPDSVGGRRCKNIISNIESKELAVQTERVWNHEDTELVIDYRNINAAYFRLVRFDPVAFLQSNENSPENEVYAQRDSILRRRPVKSWSVELPPTEDHKPRSQRIQIPKELPIGSYLLIACSDDSFRIAANQISASEVWVSNLALVTRGDPESGQSAGFVVDADSGNGIEGATVEAWVPMNNGYRKKEKTVRTDAEGRFEIPGVIGRRAVFFVRHNADSMTSERTVRATYRSKEQTGQITNFFTDRAIYRPGQTIRYKGVCHRYDQSKDG